MLKNFFFFLNSFKNTFKIKCSNPKNTDLLKLLTKEF